MVDTLVAVASFYFTCDINLKARGWQRLVGSECVVLMWWCMCGGGEGSEGGRGICVCVMREVEVGEVMCVVVSRSRVLGADQT